jgi:large subunit ribosomal protein L4
MPKKQQPKNRRPRSKASSKTTAKSKAAKASKSAVASAPKKLAIQLLNDAGKPVETLPLDAVIAESDTNTHLLYQAAVAAQANRRQGTVKTKNRSEVRGGGKKPWRQKGTGRARHGSIRSPLWRGGGVMFGPRPRDYRIELPKTLRTQALIAGLKDKAQEGKFFMVEEFRSKNGKTRDMAAVISKWPCRKPVVVTDAFHEETLRSVRNIPTVSLRTFDQLASMDVMEKDACVLTRKGYDSLIGRLKEKAS